MILFFDTETTGLVDMKAPSSAEHQPHLVQLGMMLTTDDLREVAVVNLVVNPGVEVPEEASNIHGITTHPDALSIPGPGGGGG